MDSGKPGRQQISRASGEGTRLNAIDGLETLPGDRNRPARPEINLSNIASSLKKVASHYVSLV